MTIDRREYVDGYVIGYEWDGTTVTRGIMQPKIRETLELNKRLRNEHIPASHMGRWALSMDELDRKAVSKLFPDVDAPDPETRAKAWRRFFASPMSEPYRVRDKL